MKTNNLKILHIDDDPDDLHLFRRAILSVDEQSQIIDATDGEDGLRQLRSMKDENDLPGLIVLDINMPKVNGREACLMIKKDAVLSSIPLVIFSTSSSSLDKLFFQGKNVEYITKPTDYDVLVEIATKMLSFCNASAA